MPRCGRPIAALVDIHLFERIRRLQDDFQHLTDALGQSYGGVDRAIAEAEFIDAIADARREPAATGVRKPDRGRS